MGNLERPAGQWAGSCEFRLMPNDAFRVGDSAASIDRNTVQYSWTHPDDGPQTGRLVRTTDGATWTDSWHQPAPAQLTGGETDGELRLEMTYLEDWRWIISLTEQEDEAIMVMYNVIPPGQERTHDRASGDEHAPGPYVVMQARWRRG